MKLHCAGKKIQLLLVGISWFSSEGFTPFARARNDALGTAHHALTSTSLGFRSPTAPDERMTSEDEDILFGGSSPSSPPFPGRHRKKSRTGNLLPDNNAPLNPMDHSSSDPLINKLRTMRETVTNCPQLWTELTMHCGDRRALLDEHMCDETIDLTFSQMHNTVQKSAAIFSSLGVKKGVHVAILGENSAKWLVADHGIQMAGGISAVRGADAPIDELKYIYEHSDSAGVAVLQGPRLLAKLAKDAKSKGLKTLGLSNDKHGPVKTILLMHKDKKSNEEIADMAKPWGIEVHVFGDLLEAADPISSVQVSDVNVGLDDVATIVYTSGTTGNPKGVMLTHRNLLHQLGHRLGPTKPYEETEPLPGETMLSLLPVWHITERTFELFMASRGCNVVYSSIRTFKNDLAKHKPEWLVLVPRVLEKVATGVQNKFESGSAVVQALVKFFTATSTMKYRHAKIAGGLVMGDEKPNGLQRLLSQNIVRAISPLNFLGDKLVWKKVKDGFGGNLKVIISGGSALSGGLEDFYETAGLCVLVGYGLTECSPLIAYRRSGGENLVTPGCVGKATLDTDLRVVDPESKADEGRERAALPDGEAGVVMGRGPQVMKGYYKNSEATAKAIDEYGWFDTGDLGMINPATGDLILTGRAKDTIVLSNGENIEPTPIEDALLTEVTMMEQVMLVGQDGRRLVAIPVLNPKELASAGFLTQTEADSLQLSNDKINDPKCTEEVCATESNALHNAAEKLRSDTDLKKLLVAEMKKATEGFRPWEQVSDVYITLEPFAMSNGQLTQSYKVKRDSVLKRYQDNIV